LGHGFDKALAVNTVGFWADTVEGLGTIRQALRPGGTIAVVSQPRCPGATAVHSRKAADELEKLLDNAGYDARTETLDALDPPAVCVLARAPMKPVRSSSGVAHLGRSGAGGGLPLDVRASDREGGRATLR
jgi:hypothetical protein